MPMISPLESIVKMNQSVCSTAYTTQPVWFRIIAAKGVGFSSCIREEYKYSYQLRDLLLACRLYIVCNCRAYPKPPVLSHIEHIPEWDEAPTDCENATKGRGNCLHAELVAVHHAGALGVGQEQGPAEFLIT